MSELVVQDVRVVYGDVTAIDGFSVEVASGEIMAVVGPSGSGKSTLLRAVAGLEPLRRGRITLAGRDLNGVPTHRRGLGMMFQDHGLFTHLDVADNIAYGLRTAGVARSDQQTRVDELLKLVNLDGYGSRRTDELSGGEAQRVALARALAPEPGLLMLDEPLGSLDRSLREQLTGELRRLLTELGQTALQVTHDQAEAFALADRVVVVDRGRPVAVGSPAELWADPGTRFVAEFLGHANIWSVEVDEAGSLRWGGRVLGRLPSQHPLRAHGPGPVSAVMPATGLRPEPGGGDEAVVDGEEVVDGEAGVAVGPLPVVVAEVVFRRGVYDVKAEVSGGAEELVEFTTTEAVSRGSAMRLSVDVSVLRPLKDP